MTICVFLFLPRQQLARWTRVSLHAVLRGGQRTLNGYVTRARDTSKRPANDDDDGAVAAASKQRREDAPPERPQRLLFFVEGTLLPGG